MKNPKFRIGAKVKVYGIFTTVIAIELRDRNSQKKDFYYSLASFNKEEWEDYIEKPTDYELGTYY